LIGGANKAGSEVGQVVQRQLAASQHINGDHHCPDRHQKHKPQHRIAHQAGQQHQGDVEVREIPHFTYLQNRTRVLV
jgi:hypothetical protein